MKIYDFNGKKNICGERVHLARRRLKLSQSDLAAQMQVAGILIEIGTRFVPDYELPVFASLLHVSVPWLLGIEE